MGRALPTDRPIRSREKARALGIQGWNIRCNRCGDYGATWQEEIHGRTARPHFGSLALCPIHKQELLTELDRHRIELGRLTVVNYEQEPSLS